jgi:hypothetical protein
MVRLISFESDADGFELQKRERDLHFDETRHALWLAGAQLLRVSSLLESKGCEGGTCLMRDFLISFLWRFRMGNKEEKNVLRSLEEEEGGLNIYGAPATALVGSSRSYRSQQGWQEKRRIERAKEQRKARGAG